MEEPVRGAKSNGCDAASMGPPQMNSRVAPAVVGAPSPRCSSGRGELEEVQMPVLSRDADEEHLEEGGVASRRPVRASTVVGSREEGVPLDALAVEEGGVQRRDEVAPAGEQVAHAEAEDGVLVP
uniref:Uncharacterized protein n=1 Tax=Arundo donax TaxID=35708 RepID=A0A0A9DBX6_ARUDO